MFSLVVCKKGHILVGSCPDDKNQDFIHWLVKYEFDLQCFEGKKTILIFKLLEETYN